MYICIHICIYICGLAECKVKKEKCPGTAHFLLHIGAAGNFLQVQNLFARHDKVTDSTSFTPRRLNSEAESPSKNSRTLSFPLQISLSHTLAISSSSENKKRKKLQISETNLSFTGERGTVPADAAEGGEAVGGTGPRLRGCHQAGH